MANHCIKLLICFVVMIFCATQTLSECSDGSPKGEVQEIGGLKSYVTGPKDSKISVILISDIFGYEVPHLRKIADKIGAAGFYALVPDFFRGDPYVSGRPEKPYNDWIKEHPAKNGIKDAKRVIAALKNKGILKIGGAGFCWGGKVVVDLSQSPYIQAAVLLHPTYVTVKDIQGEKVPISILGGQNDTQVPPDLIKDYESALKAKKPKVDSLVKIIPGAQHGWTTRYNDTDKAAVKRAREAHRDTLHWFIKYLT
ncbi:hypothetical protein CASFOL_012758 [Castilleja foliolosa]|uniref:Dienelactone hydrolase domain-containing protein n=1 Tax=Castilleja foliolosa TaxID=1961234 RepID=A0ABD3DIK1_9LAMI